MLVCNVAYPAMCINSGIEFWCFFSWKCVCVCVCVWKVFSFYLKINRTKKFASKQKFIGNKYVCVNKGTGVSEKGQSVSDQSG
jgi:hypothetical protein